MTILESTAINYEYWLIIPDTFTLLYPAFSFFD